MGRVLSNQGGEGRAEGRYDDDVLICRYPGKHNASHLSPNCQHLHWDHSVEGFSYEFLNKILTSAEGKHCDSLSPWAPCIRPALDCIMSTLDRFRPWAPGMLPCHISILSKYSLDRKQPRKKKVLGPPTFNYKKLSIVYSQIRTNYPQVPDESQVNAKRKPGV